MARRSTPYSTSPPPLRCREATANGRSSSIRPGTASAASAGCARVALKAAARPLRDGQAAGTGADVERRAAHRAHDAARARGRRDGERGPRSGALRRRAPRAIPPDRGRLFHVTHRPLVSRETALHCARETVLSLRGSSRSRRARSSSLRGSSTVCSTPVGVTAIRDPSEAATRHVLDALAGLPAVDAAPDGAARRRRQRRWAARTRAGGHAAEPRDAPDRGDRSQGGVHRGGSGRARHRGAGARRALGGARPGRRCATPAPASSPAHSHPRPWPPSCACRCARPVARLVLWSREPASAELAFAAGELGGEVVVPRRPRACS